MITEIRYASHPGDVKLYDTGRLRREFLISRIFEPGEICLTYSMFDRFVAGGAMPVNSPLLLEDFPELRASYFLERRELGIVNVGGAAEIRADGTAYRIENKEALYLGKGIEHVEFISVDPKLPARLYMNSAPAHQNYPSRKITLAEAESTVTGSAEASNHRIIRKLLINKILPTCQLQMGMTSLSSGSVWNTMPAHTHTRRMETYFYFEVPENQAVCHFMGEPQETRHIWVNNEQAVISPSWSIHSAAGTSNYTFVWGMAGENLDYSDMDPVQPTDLK
jgi:4-deoxy-L-threo-5-hexosulose-uronate ketol-isomerase